ncbi:unnamed protein product [Cylicocyclus nassatus]|uniref:Uncharacterized protein n=1 Tax=Cylicocyclus nassatus TaxID=53992 RepID=A0AA36GQQ9_CYLNA|nr:unnamed protein product [Cylicocyclus nassatus]
MGQTSTSRTAEHNADKDLRATILSTFAENGIPTDMAALKYEYKAPKILLANGSRCERPGTYVVYHGAVAYKCVEDEVVARRGKRRVNFELLAAGDPTGITDLSTSTTESTDTATISTANADGSSSTWTTATNAGITTTNEEGSTPDNVDTTTVPGKVTDGPAPPTDAPMIPGVRSEQYEISGEVTVETQMAIYESQWATLAEKIQEKLEGRHVLFIEDIIVTLL